MTTSKAPPPPLPTASPPAPTPAPAFIPPAPIAPPAAGDAATSAAPAIPGLIFPFPHLINQAQAKKKINKAKEDAIAMRKQLWPDVGEEKLWLLSDKTKKGFSSLPRTMPLLMNIIADASKQVSKKSVPAGKAYLVLWCRVFGEAFVKVENEMVFAAEAGYTGERSISTWREHLRVLKDLGFIDYKAGPGGPVYYVLLLNPYHVIKDLRARQWISETAYMSLFQRAMDIGATADLAE